MIQATKKILSILTKKQRRFTGFLVVLMIIGGAMESLGVSLIMPLLEAVTGDDAWDSTWYGAAIRDIFGIGDVMAYIRFLLVALILVYIIKNIYLLAEYYIQNAFVGRGRFQVQQNLLRSYMAQPYVFFLSSNTGEIMRIITSDTSEAFSLFTSVLQFYTEAIISVIIAITVFAISPTIAVFLGILLVIEMLVISKVIKPVMQRLGLRARNHAGYVNKWILQSLNGMKSIKVGHSEKFFDEKYSGHATIVVDAECKRQTLSNLPRLIIEAVTVAGALGFVIIMINQGTDLVNIIPQLSAFVVAAVRLLPSVNRISTAINAVQYSEGALDNVIKNLNEVCAKTDNHMELPDNSGVEPITFEKDIHLQDISFHYPDSEEFVLEHANMEIKAGQSIGVVGPSGAGKTTTIDLILGLLDPNGGKVLVDGRDIQENLISWRDHLAYIPQSIFLMDDTIRGNVAFGLHRDEIDEEAVWTALREAQLEDFVKGLEDGLDTVIGEQGVRLSGGQRQRIGIARALYHSPRILFFDEATSALDNETEAAIMDSINHLKGKVTLVIIAHRLTTIENCDLVYRVENKQITRKEKD